MNPTMNNTPATSNTYHPTQSLPPPLRTLRRSFELLSISYFLNIFGSILSIQGFSVSKLEADLDGNLPDSYAPTLIPKLLVALTGDRTTNYSNWESRLRREFLRREPNANPLGEEPAKSKPKFPKRAVGYVYIAEPIPPSSLPSNAQPTQLAPPQDHLVPPSNQPTIQPSAHPQPLSESDQLLLNLPAQPLSTDSEFHQHPSSSIQSHHPSKSADSTPSLKTSNPDQDQTHFAPIQPKQTLLETGANSSSAPQPSQNEAGTTTKTWSSLSPTVKLKTIFKLCEWHFSTPHDLERFRRLVDLKSYSNGSMGLDDRFDWRQECCGIDSLGNQYWLAGHGIEARLWIQRQEPQPIRKSITLRIPARPTQKRKGATLKYQTRHPPSQVPTTSSSSSATTASKRPRLAATRCSTRLRATQSKQPPTTSAPTRPPTMIVIKKPSLSQKTQAPRLTSKGVAYQSTRPSPRQRMSEEVWQDVPPGWLKEVVAPTSNHQLNPPDFSSDLSDMSDDDDESQTEQNMVTSTFPKNSLPTSTGAESNSNNHASNIMDESLSELTESTDASTVVTCDSLSSDLDTCASEINPSEEDSQEPIENNAVENAETLGSNGLVTVKTEDKLTVPETMGHTLTETSLDLENQMICESEEKPTDLKLEDPKLKRCNLMTETDPGTHTHKSTPSTNTSSFDPTTKTEKNIDPVPMDRLSSHSAVPSQTNALTSSSKDVPQCSPLLDGQNAVKSTVDDASDSLFPQMKGHPLDPDWIEWEVICSNLDEWKQFGLQFQNSECLSERKLNEYINREILPDLLVAYEAEETRIQKEEAMAQHKRSTRLTTKEATAQSVNSIDSEITLREGTRMHSTRLEAKRLREIEMEEAKKQQKEEDQRLVRLREREERIALREAQLAAERDAELKRAERARLRAESKLMGNAVKVARAGAENSVPSINSDQQWKLNCEICGASGINMDDGSEVICCDGCEDWQHLNCHDKADEIMRRPKKDWSTSDFMCSNCSGVPIPRAVKRLKTHVNGKPKIQPRSSSLSKCPKAINNHHDGIVNDSAGVNPSFHVSPIDNSSPSPTKSHKLTILMSNPNKLGGTSLSEVFPNPDVPIETDQVSHKLENGRRSIHNNIIDKPPGPEVQTGAEHAKSTAPATNRSAETGTGSTLTVPDLSIYYDDLEKLRRILRTNTHLHRTLPMEVMKRLRNYLIDRQKALESSNHQHRNTSKKTDPPINNSSNSIASPAPTAPTPIQPSIISPFQSQASPLALSPTPTSAIDPQLQLASNSHSPP